MSIRKIVFWIHLFIGVVAGIIVLLMSVTGVALTYQKQMTAWADKRLYKVEAPAGASAVSAELLLNKFREARPGLRPMSVTLSSDPAMPAAISTGSDEVLFVNPYSGEILGPGAHGMRKFFRVMTDWHRWLSLSGENRKFGRAVTGACNFGFLLLALTGLYLWWPARWTRGVFRSIAWFRSGVSGKLRDSNWHYTFGFWCIVPLIIIIASGVVISYPWASNLVFRLAGSEPPAGGLRRGPGGPGGRPGMDMRSAPMDLSGLDRSIEGVAGAVKGWKTITFQPQNIAGPVATFTVDRSLGGQPQLRSTIKFDKAAGRVVGIEEYKDADSGMRARIWLRFAHTGEYYGIIGQTIAGIASLAGVILVWTGIALCCRRYISWLRRRVV